MIVLRLVFWLEITRHECVGDSTNGAPGVRIVASDVSFQNSEGECDRLRVEFSFFVEKCFVYEKNKGKENVDGTGRTMFHPCFVVCGA